MHAFLLSFGVIFVAELGDKSQLMAMAFSARYRPVPVLIGITAATALVHLFSVIAGALRIEVTLLAGPHKGEVLAVTATNLRRDPLDLLAAPGTLAVADGVPHLTIDD